MLQSFTLFCNVLHFAHPPHTEQDTERRCKVQPSEDVNDCAVVGAADPVKGQVPGSCVAGADVIRVLEMIESCTIGIIAGELVGCHMDNASSCVAGLQVYYIDYIMSYVTLENGRTILFDMFFIWVFFLHSLLNV